MKRKIRINHKEHIFPFEHIVKGSNVAIYGLGENGERYIKQIEATGWCNLLCISDRDKDKAQDWDYEYKNIDDIANDNRLNYIIITITKLNVLLEVYDELLKKGADKEKIVIPYCHESTIDDLKNMLKGTTDDRLVVNFVMLGGIGDGVMETAFYSELVRMVPDIIIDIYGEPYQKYIYMDKPNVRNFYDCNVEEQKKDGYDLVLSASWGITVSFCNYAKVKAKSEELYSKIIATDEYLVSHSNSLPVRIWRAKLLKHDKFWLMGRDGIWDVKKENISVNLTHEFKSKYEELHLSKFITLNCGADMRRKTDDTQFPTKVWPKKYFEEFIIKFKAKYPDYEVIQLGDQKQEPMAGADRYLLGEDLELVKYILQGSWLHIDDEGGLVHIATALKTKCIVLFGPTPLEVLAYPQNINICTNICQGCFSYVNDWNLRCELGMREPKCMYSITPEMVMQEVDNYLSGEL